MREAPDLDVAELIAVVRRSWDPSVDALEYLPLGFGAHHWQARVGGAARYFVTLDQLGERHTLQTLHSAYAGAATLFAEGLRFVTAPIEPYAVPFAQGAVTLTLWLDAVPVTTLDRHATARMLAALHAVESDRLGGDLPRWRPVVGPDLPVHLAGLAQRAWLDGPYGERSREAIAATAMTIRRWTTRYLDLGRAARSRRWVPTHGEPGPHNQLSTPSGITLVDWESLKLAPAERDLRTLRGGDPLMLEMFDLEWRLDEISQYAAWFAGPHGDTEDDRIAFHGLLHELAR